MPNPHNFQILTITHYSFNSKNHKVGEDCGQNNRSHNIVYDKAALVVYVADQ